MTNTRESLTPAMRLTRAIRPARVLQLVLNNPLGGFLSSQVIDRPTLWWVTQVFMPLSRLWAAADQADGDVDRFLAAAGAAPPVPWDRDKLARILMGFERLKAQAKTADVAWERAFFDSSAGTEFGVGADLAALERARINSAQRLLLARARFLPLILRGGVPAVRFDIRTPTEAAALYDPAAPPGDFFRPPQEGPKISLSRAFHTPVGRNYWLRFSSPAGPVGDRVWARVYEPDTGVDLPTVIFSNGVCIEWDQMRGHLDLVRALCRAGCRVIALEAPAHGRRRDPGTYSGEPFLARAPVGGLQILAAQVQEIALLTRWLRNNGVRRVGLAGISMGALASLLAAAQARHWDRADRPDALALITFSAALHRLPLDSTLARHTGLRQAVGAAGWSAAALDHFSAFTDVSHMPALAPENIFAVLGRRDDVTPFADAQPLLADWRVPLENIYTSGGGHFSTPLATSGNHPAIVGFIRALKDT